MEVVKKKQPSIKQSNVFVFCIVLFTVHMCKRCHGSEISDFKFTATYKEKGFTLLRFENLLYRSKNVKRKYEVIMRQDGT